MSKKDFESLKNDIISYAGLGRSEASGFYSIHCPMCNDNKRKTGGFKFENDQIVYNCFHGSCPSNTVYTYDDFVPRKFRQLMDTIGVTIPISLSVKRSKLQKKMEEDLDAELYKKSFYEEMEIPDDWIPLAEAKGEVAEFWKEYFEERATPLADIYLINEGKYRKMCAIAMFFYDKMIGFQVATGNDNGAKYLNITENENLIYLPERKPQKIAIIVEGILDAKCFPNTIGTLNSKLSPYQAYHIKDCEEWWFLPDKVSSNFMKNANEYGRGKVIIPDWNESDLNSAVQRFGVMEVAERLRKNLIDDMKEAEIRYQLWTKRK